MFASAATVLLLLLFFLPTVEWGFSILGWLLVVWCGVVNARKSERYVKQYALSPPPPPPLPRSQVQKK